jgi:hypothetical protein
MWALVGAGDVSDSFTFTTGASALILASIVLGIGSGTFQAFCDVQDAGGNWVQVAACTAQTTASLQTAIATSLASAVSAGSTGLGRFRWTATGSTSIILSAVAR